MNQLENYLTTQQLCNYLSVCAGTIHRYVKKGMPSIKLGKAKSSSRRFNLTEVQNWLKSQEMSNQ